MAGLAEGWEALWQNRWTTALICGAFLATALGFIIFSRLLPGVSIAVLAVGAAVMSLRPQMRPMEKAAWMVIIGALLFAELRAIVRDRHEAQVAQEKINLEQDQRLAKLLSEERVNTQKLLQQENGNLEQVIKTDQRDFTKSLSAVVAAHKDDERHFSQIASKEEGLIKQQQDLSEEFAGRLVPALSPSPENACSSQGHTFPNDAITTIYGDNAFINLGKNGQPITSGSILTVGNTRVIGFDRVPGTNTLALSIDFRDKQNRVLLRVDKNGVVNRSSLILLHPDKSRFLIQDEYGNDFLDIDYINDHTFGVAGKAVYCGRSITLSMFHGSCAVTAGTTVVEITEPPCPMPQQ